MNFDLERLNYDVSYRKEVLNKVFLELQEQESIILQSIKDGDVKNDFALKEIEKSKMEFMKLRSQVFEDLLEI